MRRPVNGSFNILAWPATLPSPQLDDIGQGGRTHYFPDCTQITGNGCLPFRVPQRWLDHRPERGLCWTCVGRLVDQAERAAELVGERA